MDVKFLLKHLLNPVTMRNFPSRAHTILAPFLGTISAPSMTGSEPFLGSKIRMRPSLQTVARNRPHWLNWALYNWNGRRMDVADVTYKVKVETFASVDKKNPHT